MILQPAIDISRHANWDLTRLEYFPNGFHFRPNASIRLANYDFPPFSFRALSVGKVHYIIPNSTSQARESEEQLFFRQMAGIFRKPKSVIPQKQDALDTTAFCEIGENRLEFVFSNEHDHKIVFIASG